jgi:PKHD-type hydroxylase
MFYRSHTDAPIQGAHTQLGRTPGRFGQNFVRTDYSMTLFLAAPESYDGGELELRFCDEVRRVKLRAGSAVCYSTGIPHSVCQVTRGSRIAAIYWFQSLIRDPHVRRVIWDQYELEQALLECGQTELALRASDVRKNLIRYLAEV